MAWSRQIGSCNSTEQLTGELVRKSRFAALMLFVAVAPLPVTLKANPGSVIAAAEKPLASLCATSVDNAATSIAEAVEKIPGPSSAPVVLSVVAIFIALATLAWRLWSEKVARGRSIEDEFWIRTVAFPIVIEPLLKWIAKLPARLPSEKSDAAYDAEKTRAFGLDMANEFNEHYELLPVFLECVGSGHRDEHDRIRTAIEELDDGIITYCGYNSGRELPKSSSANPLATKTQFAVLANRSIAECVAAVRTIQSKIQ